MSSRKKLTLAILILLTVVLAGISIYVTVRLQESQAPTETGAATGAGYTNVCGTNNASWSNRDPQCRGCTQGSCSGAYVYKFICNGRHNQCGGSGATPVEQHGPSSSQSLGGERCGVTVQIDVFEGANFSGLKDFFVYYTGDCTSTQPPTTGQVRCGGLCNTTADCYPAANGGTVVCRDEGSGVKRCANALCPVGQTIPGANCDCAAGRTCGQTCNASVGLCGDGKSVCRYIVGPACNVSNPSGTNTTYCVPTVGPGAAQLTTAKCVSRDQGNSYVLYQGRNPTPAEIQQLCNMIVQTTTCYRCTTSNTDGNACEAQDFEGASCPSGWTTNSNCAQAAGGSCPVQQEQTTCYRCTTGTTDGNACESQTVQGTSCPSGWTTNSNCATAAPGGACAVETPTVNASASCVDGSNQLTISWNSITGDNRQYYVDISETSAFTSPNFYHKQTNNVNQTTAPNGFTRVANDTPLTLEPTRTYYVRVAYSAISNLYSNVSTVTTLSCATTQTIQCYRCTTPTTDGNNCEEQTFEGASCPSGWSENSNCAQAAGGSCPVQVACGASCNETNLCAAGHTCNAGICKLDACLTPGACSDNSCTPVGPVCGATCSSNEQCPSNHSCIGNKCTLNGCTGTTCANGCTPLCGGPCSSDLNCPSNHSCQAGKCVLNGCTASTCVNGCSTIPTIPETAIGDDARLLVIGSLFIVAGYGAFKLSGRRNLLSSFVETISASYEDKAERRLKRKAEK